MKIISVWSLERDDCLLVGSKLFGKGRYCLYFGCGLVASSRFFSRLSLLTKQEAVTTHAVHHSQSPYHGTSAPYGLMACALSQDRPWVYKVIKCGPGCDSYSENKIFNILDRSDIVDEPIAKIKEGSQIFELRLTISNQLLCSCMARGVDQVSGVVCSHVIKLLSGNSSGVTWDKGQKDTASRVVKRRMLFDE